MEKKKVLLLALIDYGLYQSIKENLEKNGYDVTLVLNYGYEFSYTSMWDRLQNFLHKIFLRDYTYKDKLRKSFLENKQVDIINEEDYYDYCIVIRSDFFPIDILKAAKLKSRSFVSYHYDGLGRNKKVFERIDLFDHFFVFDKNDIKKYPEYNLNLVDNFYFDCYPRETNQERAGKAVYFLGSYHPSRLDDMLLCYNILREYGLEVDIDLLINAYLPDDSPLYQNVDISLLKDVIPYKSYLEKISPYGILLDLLIAEHQGLSFRIFEGLYYQKKVITNNKSVRERDFYHPNNYFIIENNNFNGLEEFIAAPYKNIDSNIVEQYSFTSWLNTLLNKKD